MCRKVLYREYDENNNLIKKECSKCGGIKSVNDFHRNNTNKDGYIDRCKICLKEYQHQYYENNKEKVREKHRNYYESNKEKMIEKGKEYIENNKEKIKERKHMYYKNNKEKLLEYHHQHYQENKEKIAEYGYKHYQENKEKILEHQRQYKENKLYKEINKIYENVTKNLYPNNDIQYGIIYGVHCIPTDRWYIGQTRKSFNLRYANNFFKRKFIELLGDNEKLQLLHEDIEKYGQEIFEIFEVLDVAFSEKELDEKEAYYIDLYKAYDEGYNSNRGNIFKHNKLKRKEVI